MILYCNTYGCSNTLTIDDSNFNAIYTCRLHTPKVESDVHFQDCQFDRKMGSGTDPKAYERGMTSGHSESSRRDREGSKKQQADEKIEESLAGHKNAVEILKILKADVRK